MGISRLTAYTIGNNYPESILIEAIKHDDEKYSGWIHLMRDGRVHATQLSTQPIFDSAAAATGYMTELAEWCVKYINEQTNEEQ